MKSARAISSTAHRKLCSNCRQLLQRVRRTGWMRWLPFSRKAHLPGVPSERFSLAGDENQAEVTAGQTHARGDALPKLDAGS